MPDELDAIFDSPTATLPKKPVPKQDFSLDSIFGDGFHSATREVMSRSPLDVLGKGALDIFNTSGIPEVIRAGKKKVVNAISPSEKEIEAEAAKTQSVPYGKIAGRVAAETAASLVPETGEEITLAAATPMIAKELVGAYPALGQDIGNIFKRFGYDTFDIPAPKAKDVIPLERLNQIKGGAPMTEPETNVMQGKSMAKVSVKKDWLQAMTPSEGSSEKGLVPYSIYQPEELQGLLARDAQFSEIGSKAPVETPQPVPTTPEGLANDAIDAIFDHGDHGEAKTPETEEMPTGKSIVEPTQDLKPIKVTDSVIPGTNKVIPLDPKDPQDAKTIFRNIIDNHLGNIAADKFDSTRFVKETFMDKLNPLEQDATTFLIEKGALPKPEVLAKFYGDPKKAQAVMQLVEEPTPAMEEAVKEFRTHDDMNHKIAKGIDDDIGYVRDHVMHLWDLGKYMQSVQPSSISTYNPSTNSRSLRDYATGMNKGFVPKTLNIGEITSTADNYTIRMKRVTELVKNLKAAHEANGMPLAMKDSEAKSFPMFESINHKLFNGYRFHPDVAEYLNKMIERPLDNKWINAYEIANAFDKQVKLNMGFFHHATLTQMAMSLGTLNPANPASVVKFAKSLADSFSAGNAIWTKDPEFVRDALFHGLKLGEISDFQVSRVEKVIKETEQLVAQKLGKAATFPIEVIRSLNTPFQKSLWPTLNNTVMLDAYESMVADALKRFPDTPPGVVKKQVAEFVNHATGHEIMDKIIPNRGFRRILQGVFLSPEFNIGIYRSVLDALSGGIKIDWSQFKPSTTTYFSDSVKGAYARRTLARAIFWYLVIGNAINYERTKSVFGKGRFMWENEADHKMTPFVYKDLDGRNTYVNIGKVLIDPIRLLSDPLHVIPNKVAALPRTVINQMFPSQYLQEKFEKGGATERVKAATTDLFEPFILSKSQMGKAKTGKEMATEAAKNLIPFSISKGMTPHKLEVEIYKALKDNDVQKLNSLREQARSNNINFNKSYGYAKRGLTAEQMKSQKEGFTLAERIPAEVWERMKKVAK